jgi:hypothetical protein
LGHRKEKTSREFCRSLRIILRGSMPFTPQSNVDDVQVVDPHPISIIAAENPHVFSAT